MPQSSPPPRPHLIRDVYVAAHPVITAHEHPAAPQAAQAYKQTLARLTQPPNRQAAKAVFTKFAPPNSQKAGAAAVFFFDALSKKMAPASAGTPSRAAGSRQRAPTAQFVNTPTARLRRRNRQSGNRSDGPL